MDLAMTNLPACHVEVLHIVPHKLRMSTKAWLSPTATNRLFYILWSAVTRVSPRCVAGDPDPTTESGRLVGEIMWTVDGRKSQYAKRPGPGACMINRACGYLLHGSSYLLTLTPSAEMFQKTARQSANTTKTPLHALKILNLKLQFQHCTNGRPLTRALQESSTLANPQLDAGSQEYLSALPPTQRKVTDLITIKDGLWALRQDFLFNQGVGIGSINLNMFIIQLSNSDLLVSINQLGQRPCTPPLGTKQCLAAPAIPCFCSLTDTAASDGRAAPLPMTLKPDIYK